MSLLQAIWLELGQGWPDTEHLARVAVRLVAAMLLGAVLGYERERTGKPAGLRTHMLVAMGSALFVLIPTESGTSLNDLTRVIQGVATGIGFIGAGAILKLSDEREIRGLTTAASIWMTAAVGVAAGLGRLGSAIVSIILAWIILSIVRQLANRIEEAEAARKARRQQRTAAQQKEVVEDMVEDIIEDQGEVKVEQ